MSSPQYEIRGLQELNTGVNGIPAEFNKIFQSVGKKYADSINSTQSSQSPVRTGYMRSTIGSKVSQTQIEIFVDAKYSKFVNFGTYRMPARPFFTQPAEQGVPKMIQEMNKSVASYIKTWAK